MKREKEIKNKNNCQMIFFNYFFKIYFKINFRKLFYKTIKHKHKQTDL